MDFLQNYFYLTEKRPKTYEKKSKKYIWDLGLAGSSKVNQIYVGFRRFFWSAPCPLALGIDM
jgi:hypothetical protein